MAVRDSTRSLMAVRKRVHGQETLLDTIVGDGGDQTLMGTESADLIQGLGGRDLLIALGGKDRLEGGEGSDTLVGGRGKDVLVGGESGDVFRFESVADSKPGKADVITLYKGGDSIDTSAIDADKATAGDQDFVHVAALTGVAGQLSYRSNGAGGTIVEGDVDGDGVADLRIEIQEDSRDSLLGGDSDDTLIGYDDQAESILGGNGDDSLLGGDGSDTLFGDFTIAGGDGDDSLLGGDGNDSLNGGSFNDSLEGGDGDDTLVGMGEFDVLDGGDGDDQLFGTLTSGSSSDVPDIIDGGKGSDTIHADADSTVTGGSGDDVITVVNSRFGFARGHVNAGSGDDTVIGELSTFGGSVFYTIIGGQGEDSLSGVDNGSDTIDGGAENDTLAGLSGNDVLMGGFGADLLDGGENADTLIGGAGGDTLKSGKSADVFKYENVSDSTPLELDLIVKLTDRKTIDLSAIDADAATPGDQAFAKVPDFTATAGELRLRFDGATGDTFIEGDVDGDGLADLAVRVSGDQTEFSSFVL